MISYLIILLLIYPTFVGNIRVFCRIRPTFNSTSRSSIEYIGEDGSVMVFDPLKPQSTRKVFQFNKVFGPKATQGKLSIAFVPELRFSMMKVRF